MPEIKINDETTATITSVPIESNPLSALTKYVKNDAINLIFLPNLVGALKQPVIAASGGPLELDLKFGPKVDLGAGKPAITIAAGASAAVHVAAGPSKNLFPDNRFGAPVPIDPTTGYVSLALGGTLNVGVTAKSGSLSFGFQAGGGLGIEYFRAFAITPAAPTVAQALGAVISHFVIPGDLEDLRAMQQGDVTVVSGNGSLTISASVNLLAAANPLASVNLPLNNTLSIKAGASVDVKASFKVSGEYQIRVRKLDATTVELGYYKKSGEQFTLGLSASAGVSATLGKFDLISKLIHAVSKDPEADIEKLVNAGLSDAEIKKITDAIAASLNRNLEASLNLTFSAMKSDDAAFLYQVDLSNLNAASRAAIEAALNADLTQLNDMEPAMAADGTIGSGVKLVRSRMTELRKRSLSFKLNLLGILNFSSVSELILKGETVFEPATGDLTISEKVSGTSIGILSEPFKADGEKLRKVMFDSLLFTTALRATRTTVTAGFTSSQLHFAMNQDTTRSTFSSYLDGFVACGLLTAGDKGPILDNITGSCPSTYLLRTEYDDAASEALFLDGAGQPFSRQHYDRIGRDALADLLPNGSGDDPDGLRRMTLLDDALWARMQEGQGTFRTVLPSPRNEQPHLGAITADYTLIEWWADAMRGAAELLASLRVFIGAADPATLHSDPEFKKRFDDLQKHFRNVVKNSKPSFGKPWGLTALYRSAKPAVGVTGVIVSRLLTKFEQLVPVVGADRGMPFTELLGADASRAVTGLTGPQKEQLRPYVVNLRMGAFSDHGEFTTSQEDLDRIFGEELPKALAKAKAARKKLQLMFYAHGGLVDELSGLTQVLERMNFWISNGIYPIFFVWETGLKETVEDIIKSLFTGARALAVPNALLEALARPGGLAVWSNMKRSAQLAALPTGGALAVAQKTLAFWQQNHADMRIHACGHSAGSIFHAFFLPALLDQAPTGGAPPIQVETFHLLAPACTTDLFESNLLGLIGPAKGIHQLTMYTMHKDLELADVAGPYHASLLYLVSRAFETAQPTPVLGLEESIRKDPALLRFFGLAGFDKPKADLLFSQTAIDAGKRSSTVSTSHGGFGKDQKTLDSVARRILDIGDDVDIHDTVEQNPPNSMPDKAVAITPVQTVTAPTSSGTRARKRALCIGIDEYPSPYTLGGCVNDARNWSKRLSSLGFEVTTLVNADATRAGILSGLSQMMRSAIAGDVLVLQYSGHGTQVPDLNGDEDTGLDEALCPVDFAAGHLIIDDDLRAVFQDLPLGVNFTSFMDCCHSGTITRVISGLNPANLALSEATAATLRARFIPFRTSLGQAHLKFRKEMPARELAVSRGPAEMKDVLFSACLDREVAFEVDGAGVFTSKATVVLSAVAEVLTNADFRAKVVAAFGPAPQQTPGLDCSPAMESHLFLQ